MFTRFQIYLLTGCVTVAAIILGIYQFHQNAGPRGASSAPYESTASGNAALAANNAEVVNGDSPTSSLPDQGNSANQGAESAIPNSDYSELKQAFTNFLSVMDILDKQIPSTQDAGGAVKLVELWTGANNGLGLAMDKFAKKHPEITQGSVPPPLMDEITRFREIMQKYSSVPAELRTLMKRFEDDPKISEAKEKFRQSLDHFKT
jgi:hypothetical protein